MVLIRLWNQGHSINLQLIISFSEFTRKKKSGKTLRIACKHELSSWKQFSKANIFFLLFKTVHKSVLDVSRIQRSIMFHALVNFHISAGKKLFSKDVFSSLYRWQTTAILCSVWFQSTTIYLYHPEMLDNAGHH